MPKILNPLDVSNTVKLIVSKMAFEDLQDYGSLAYVPNASVADLTVNTVPSAAETLTFQDNVIPTTWTITFQSGGGTSAVFTANAANIDITVATTNALVATAIATLFDTITVYTSTSADSAIVVTATGLWGDPTRDITIGGTNNDITSSSTNAATIGGVANANSTTSLKTTFGYGVLNGLSVLSGNIAEVILVGSATGYTDEAITPGDYLYLSSADGKLTKTAPSASGFTAFSMGTADTVKTVGAGTIAMTVSKTLIGIIV